MIREIDLFGVFLPPMAALIGAALLAWAVLRRLLDAAGVTRWAWHPALFNVAGFVLVLSIVVLLAFGFP